MKLLLSLLVITTAGATSARAHHVNPLISQELGEICIKQAGYPMCSCIEADIARGNDGRICTIPVVPAQQPLYDPWSNPFAGQGIQAPSITF